MKRKKNYVIIKFNEPGGINKEKYEINYKKIYNFKIKERKNLK